MNNDAIALQDIFVFDRIGIDENGRVRGTFKATGVRPRFVERLATSGAILRQALSLIPSGGLTKPYADCLSQPSGPPQTTKPPPHDRNPLPALKIFFSYKKAACHAEGLLRHSERGDSSRLQMPTATKIEVIIDERSDI